MIPGITKDTNGFAYLPIESSGYRAVIYQHGAHLTEYGPIEGEPILFLSREAVFKPGKAIRGGVPVICPWFGDHPGNAEAPAHGLVRAKEWNWSGHTSTDDQVTVALSTVIEPGPYFDGKLELALSITLSKQLTIKLTMRNAGEIPVKCENAFHPYFHVGDIRQVKVHGLQGCEYLDKTRGFSRETEAAEALSITGFTDRVYLNTTSTCIIEDPVLKRRIILEKEGSNSTIVWNPWIEKSRAFGDFGDDEWEKMICVEQANTAENAFTMPPGAKETLVSRIRVEGM